MFHNEIDINMTVMTHDNPIDKNKSMDIVFLFITTKCIYKEQLSINRY